MNLSASDSDDATSGRRDAPVTANSAYLIARWAGRWSDVYRLKAPGGGNKADAKAGQTGGDGSGSGGRGEAILGRSSSNQIVIRSEKASRRHARVFFDGRWCIEDLGSRNGTRVSGVQLKGDPPLVALCDGDTIEIGGHSIIFSTTIDPGVSPGAVDAAIESSAEMTEDQISFADDSSTGAAATPQITRRQRHSGLLHGNSAGQSTGHSAGRSGGDAGGGSASLLRLAFGLGRMTAAVQRAEATLDCLVRHVRPSTVGVYLREKPVAGKADDSTAGSDGDAAAGDLPRLIATRQTSQRSYRRPPDPLIASAQRVDAEAVLARNAAGDANLATEDSRGEINVESVIVLPVRDAAEQIWGVIHLTAWIDRGDFDSSDLEFAVTAAEVLGESLRALAESQNLGRRLHRTRDQLKQLQKRLGQRVRMIGESDAMVEVSRQISLAAPTNATVLVRGESGTGKELVAAALHHASARSEGPLVCLNCAALSPTLLESELFGHEKGAFTGATERKQGKFEAAHTGTLMLDEIGEMEADLQAKLLRVLEGHPFERVGGHRPIRADVRVIAATNRDLQAMVAEGTFREDLYYRLHVVEILMPPLRQRGDDCLRLADFFLQRFNQEMGRKIEAFTDAAKQRLLDHTWPGNVRELKNVIERAVVLNTTTVIDADDLVLPTAGSPTTGGRNVSAGSDSNGSVPGGPVERTLADLEKDHIFRVLRHTGNNKSKASAILGIERSTLDRRLKRYARDDADASKS
ncbi:sigma 54-interacting transcriptional regulator [Crateriforma spongiae]|uniref:sigma 54-interacting transcriptional regulator n=1 Tax=Crateriforma spongiae TaxID=2724528 RepID=UPI0039AFEF93